MVQQFDTHNIRATAARHRTTLLSGGHSSSFSPEWYFSFAVYNPLEAQVQVNHKNRSGMSSNPTSLSRYQFRLLAVLALINFVNFAARQVFIPLIPMLRTLLGVSDSQLGSLQTLLLVVLALGSIPFGFLADRFSRKAIIAVGILFWSVATFAGRLAAKVATPQNNIPTAMIALRLKRSARNPKGMLPSRRNTSQKVFQG